MPVFSVFDLRFLLSRSHSTWLPEELGGLAPLGPTGIRNVQGIGNNTINPLAPGFWFGSADTLFTRISFNRLLAPQKNDVISGPFANTTRGTTFSIGNTIRVLANGTALPPSATPRPGSSAVDALNPRIISNLIADVSNPIGFQALNPADPNYAIKQELLEQDTPYTFGPNGQRINRIGPADGGINPLPYSNWMSQFGQFFDHGLDFVAKGVDGSVNIELLPSDSLFSRASVGLPPGSTPAITGSRNNTVNVTIGVGSTDLLLSKLGITAATNAADFISWSPLTTTINETKAATDFFAFEGTLVLNNRIIEIFAVDGQDLITQINDWTPTTGVVASITVGAAGNLLTLTPARAESFNQISPPVDMSQNYGSDNSRTLFVREYTTSAAWLATQVPGTAQPSLIDLTTGRLVNAGVLINGETAGGAANWQRIKANAANVGLILHDKDIAAVPLVAFDANGQPVLGADGMPQLIAIHKVTGEQVFIRNTNLPADSLFTTAGGTWFGKAGEFVLAVTDHAFLNDKAAFSLAGSTLPNGVVVTNPTTGATNIRTSPTGPFFTQADFLLTSSGDNPTNYSAAMQAYFALAPGGLVFQPLDSHLIAGDGRLNENIGLTAVHEVFQTEHNRVITQLKQMYGMPDVLPAGGFDWVDPLTNVTTRISNEDLFQQAKIWVEMIYQHLTFDSFIRKLSPDVAGFAGVDPAIDSQIFAEFAHAVYRLGHSMLPEEIGLRKYQGAENISTTAGSSLVTLTLAGHGLRTGDAFTLSGIESPIGGIDPLSLNGTFTVTVLNADSFRFTAAVAATQTATGAVTDTVLFDLSRSLIKGFLSPTSFNPGFTAGLLADGSSAQVGYRIDEKVSDSLRDNLLGKPLDLATLNLMRGRDAGLPTLNELRGAIAAVAPLLLQPTLQPYRSWFAFRDNLKGNLDQQNATVKNFMMAYAADALLTKYGATGTQLGIAGRTLENWYLLRASTNVVQQQQYMTALKAAANLAFADATWMGIQGNKDFNRIDAWIGGLAEKEVVGGMLGSTFNAVFAIQMMKLQNGDFFYYLGRVPATEFFVEGMEGTQYSDLVMRNTTATDVYGDIFSVADSYLHIGDVPGVVTAASLDELTAISTTKQVFDINGNVIQASVGTAGFVNGVFTGNPGSYTDARNVLNANGIGNASEMIVGTDGNDVVNGLGGNDCVRAGLGDDTINGGSGVDYLYGGDGNDVVNGDSENDFIYANEGFDTVRGGLGIDVMFGHGGDDVMYGGLDADVMVGGSGNDLMYGGDGLNVVLTLVDPLHPDVLTVLDPEPAVAIAPLDDNIDGGSGDDTLFGGGGWDALNGSSGNDILVPGAGGVNIAGREALNGGHGDDIYIVEYASWFLDGDYTDTGLTTDQLTNKSGAFRTGFGIGIDEVRFTFTPPVAVPPNLPVAVDIVLGGTNLQGVAQLFSGIERVVIGTGFANDANRTGLSLINIDASLVASPGGLGSTQGLEIMGNAANNTFVGTAFDDLLDGGAGLDTMDGGLGNDNYILSDVGDVAIEDPLLGGGVDSVFVNFAANYTLTAQVENLFLSGVNGTENINGTGNSLDNVIRANGGNNVLLGLAGNDSIDGGAGNDTLDGGTGFDSLSGGVGNDLYIVENVSDVVVEQLNAGTDTVQSSVTHVLAGNVENLTLVGALAINGTGNELNNVINSNGGINVLSGLGGNDNLNAGAGNDTVDGGIGNDTINGGVGNDSLVGGAGNDQFVFNTTLGATTNVDRIADFSKVLNNTDVFVLNRSVFTNVNAGTVLTAAEFRSGAAVTTANAAGQRIIYNTTTGDVFYDADGSGVAAAVRFATVNPNTALAATDFTLTGIPPVAPPPVANVINGTANADNLTGTAAADSISGLAGNDTINGAAGNDTIDGGVGNDILTGGVGNDVFSFASALNATTNVDTISDFTVGTDQIALSRSTFAAFGAVATTVAVNQFEEVRGTGATLATTRLFYDRNIGGLFYDPDGSGAAAATRFATTAVRLAATDFIIF